MKGCITAKRTLACVSQNHVQVDPSPSQVHFVADPCSVPTMGSSFSVQSLEPWDRFLHALAHGGYQVMDQSGHIAVIGGTHRHPFQGIKEHLKDKSWKLFEACMHTLNKMELINH